MNKLKIVVPDVRKSKNTPRVDDVKRGNRNMSPGHKTESSPNRANHGNFNMNQFVQSANPR